ncbi:sulfite exporter TauE/SafE family protein [Chloroflexota bacterium]
MITEAHVIILLATGLAVGFASGLLGVGGGFIMAPVQYLVFLDAGLDADIAIKMAFGTNLMVIFFTSLSGAWRHNRKGAVIWKAAVVMGITGAVTALVVATFATRLPGEALRIVFGLVVLLGALRMLLRRWAGSRAERKDNLWIWGAWAVPIGAVTGLTGLGGGVLAVPIMMMVLKFKMHEAIGTSLAMIIFTSIGGLIGYVIGGWNVNGLPPYSFGYVNLWSWLLLVVGSVGMAQFGALTAHRLPAKQLRYLFIVLMFFVGLRMLGIFEWLGW